MKLKILLVISLLLSSCALFRVAEPYKINGNYYMVGDNNCVQWRVTDFNRIDCYDSSGTPTGYRTAMSQQDMMLYINKQNQSSQSNKSNIVYCKKIGDYSGRVYQFERGYCPAGYFKSN